MTLIPEAVIFGILTGGVYALMASGLTLIFGVMRIINVGHGALVILGAYLSFALSSQSRPCESQDWMCGGDRS